MKTIKFVVKVNRSGFRTPEYVQRIDRTPVQMTTRLVRQWANRVHVVNVESSGYEYHGARYQSLSQIARLITGTRWSGPLFFGIKKQKKGKSLHRGAQ